MVGVDALPMCVGDGSDHPTDIPHLADESRQVIRRVAHKVVIHGVLHFGDLGVLSFRSSGVEFTAHVVQQLGELAG